MNAREAQSGFTLIEMAVVIAIVGLLLGAILTPLATQFQARKYKETEGLLRDAQEALRGFAATRGRLPCPDVDGDGLEDEPCGAADPLDPPSWPLNDLWPIEGFLPWQTLDVRGTDAWSRVFFYRVTAEFTNQSGPGQPPGVAGRLDMSDTGDVFVSTRQQDKTMVVLAGSTPAVILSTGANGLGGADLLGTTYPAAAGGTDELANRDPDLALVGPNFVTRRVTGPADVCDEVDPAQTPCEFDDLLTWVSTTRLMALLIQTGQLP